MLRSAKYRKRTALVAGIAVLQALLGQPPTSCGEDGLLHTLESTAWIVTVVAGAVVGFIFAMATCCENAYVPLRKYLPADSSAGCTLLDCDRHSVTRSFALSFPALLLVVGVGAWIGMPTVLRPVEKVANVFGADLNQFPGYVDAKHVFHRIAE